MLWCPSGVETPESPRTHRPASSGRPEDWLPAVPTYLAAELESPRAVLTSRFTFRRQASPRSLPSSAARDRMGLSLNAETATKRTPQAIAIVPAPANHRATNTVAPVKVDRARHATGCARRQRLNALLVIEGEYGRSRRPRPPEHDSAGFRLVTVTAGIEPPRGGPFFSIPVPPSGGGTLAQPTGRAATGAASRAMTARVRGAPRSSLLVLLGDGSVFTCTERRDDDVLRRFAVPTLPVGRILLNDSPAVGAEKATKATGHDYVLSIGDLGHRGSHRAGLGSTTVADSRQASRNAGAAECCSQGLTA